MHVGHITSYYCGLLNIIRVETFLYLYWLKMHVSRYTQVLMYAGEKNGVAFQTFQASFAFSSFGISHHYICTYVCTIDSYMYMFVV